MAENTVGQGSFTYTYQKDWAILPEGQTFGTVSAVATDSLNRVYVFQRKDPPVLVFDSTGVFLNSWGDGNFVSPHGIYIENDLVYITDREGQVALKFTLDGKPLQIIGEHGVSSDTGCEFPGQLLTRSAGPFNLPTEMVPHPNGDYYISDGYGNARIHRFTSDGKLVKSWGKPGKIDPMEFHLPHSLIIGQDQNIYLCDRENSRIQIFSPEGEYLDMWTDMQRPLDISCDSDGLFYISERPEGDNPPQFSILSKSGEVLSRWPCRSAHGSWVDLHGDIYLALTAEKSVDKYVRIK
jgi:DNA-binding beta-propeller fold protein YncE